MTGSGVQLSRLLDGARVRPLDAVAIDPTIRGVRLDSRRVVAGDLFFALDGQVTDGERFVPEAVKRGAHAIVARSARPRSLSEDVAWVRVGEPRLATALLSREFFQRPDERLTLVGVTGTNGKTTVSFLLESIAVAAGRSVGRIGTVSYSFHAQELTASHTTPEAPEFFRMLAEMAEVATEIAVVEVSSHALALARTAGARYAIGAFLNLGRDHLDFHGDDDSYFAAKATLIESLTADSHAVLPADTRPGQELAARTSARVLTFGRGPEADFRLRDEKCTLTGSSAVLDTPSGPLPVRTALIGRFNLENIAAAAACASALGLRAQSVTSGVLALTRVPGRTERVDRGQPFAVIVDYAHTDDALRSLLEELRSVTQGKLHVVFGCGGERDQGKRPLMGRVAAEYADAVVITTDNPRGEDPQEIIDQVREGVANVADGLERCTEFVDRGQAIESALGQAQSGDSVVIAGKGHENTLSEADQVRSFDDRLVAARALERLGWSNANGA